MRMDPGLCAERSGDVTAGGDAVDQPLIPLHAQLASNAAADPFGQDEEAGADPQLLGCCRLVPNAFAGARVVPNAFAGARARDLDELLGCGV